MMVIGVGFLMGLIYSSNWLVSKFLFSVSNKYKIILALMIIIPFIAFEVVQSFEVTKRSEVRRLGSEDAYKEFHFPEPYKGRVVNAYSKSFAKKFNLSQEGVDEALDKRLSYVEIVVIESSSLNKRYVSNVNCVVNVLLNKGNGINVVEERITERNKSNKDVLPLTSPLLLGKYKNFNKDNFTYKKLITKYNRGENIFSDNLEEGYNYLSRRFTSCRSLIQSIKDNSDYSLNEVYWPALEEEKYLDLNVSKELIRGLYKGIRVTPNHPKESDSISVKLGKLFKAFPMILLIITRAIAGSICLVVGCEAV